MRKLLLCISFLIFSFFTHAQLRKGAFLIRGGTGYGITATNDNGYCIAGTGTIDTIGLGNVYVAKLDSNGALQWSKAIGGGLPYGDAGFSIIQAKDKGYVIVGITSNFNVNHNEKAYVIKLDSSGNLRWTQTIGGADNEQGYSVAEADDGGYVIAGAEESFGPGLDGVYVVKLDTAGNIKWTNAIGGASSDWGESIIRTSDNGYAITGATYSYGAAVGNHNCNVYVVKLDSMGTLQWTKTIGGGISDIASGIAETKDKGYAIAGETRSFGDTINGDVYAIKLDSSGNLKWAEAIGGPKNDGAGGIAGTFDGGCVITGHTYSYGDTSGGKFNVYVIKLDATGTVEWTRAVGKAGSAAEAIVQTKDSGYAITGVNDADTALYLLKLDKHGNTCLPYDSGGVVTLGGIVGTGGGVSSGGSVQRGGAINNAGSIETTFCSVTGINDIPLPHNNELSIYPNPATNKITIESSVVFISSQIFDITGRLVLSSNIQNQTYNISLDVSSLSPGMYFIRLNSDNGAEVKKFVKE